MRQHNQRFEHLPDDVRVSTAGEDAGFYEIGFSGAMYCYNP